jgi:hypothetical protein
MTISVSPTSAGANGTCRVESSWVSSSSAWPAVPSSDAAWSMPPVCAPTTSFSARRHASTSTFRPSADPPRPSPYSSSTASAAPHSRAADDESPDPSGTVSVTSRSIPPAAYPACRSAHSTPATYPAQPSGRPGPTSSSAPSKPPSSERLRSRRRSSSRFATSTTVRCAIANGRHRPSA